MSCTLRDPRLLHISPWKLNSPSPKTLTNINNDIMTCNNIPRRRWESSATAQLPFEGRSSREASVYNKGRNWGNGLIARFVPRCLDAQWWAIVNAIPEWLLTLGRRELGNQFTAYSFEICLDRRLYRTISYFRRVG